MPCDEEGRAEYVITGSSDTRVVVWRHVIGSDTWTHAATLTGNGLYPSYHPVTD